MIKLLAEMAGTTLNDFTRAVVTEGVECEVNKITVEIAARPHRPSALPIERMAVYCFFLNRQALKIGIAGPKSDARYRSQHYNPNSARSTLAGSILKHPKKIGIVTISGTSIGDWIKAHTDRINILLPASYGRPMLLRLELFLHARWKPLYEGLVSGD